MSQTYYPLSPFDSKIKEELNNRRNSRPGNDINYKPKMGWARITSLADVTFQGKQSKVGFVLHSNVGFNELYGLNNDNTSGILGFTVDGKTPHRLSDVSFMDFKRPAPGLLSIDTELHSGEGKFVKANFKYRCNDQYQFQYLSPYFMTPGVTICMEWGWSGSDNVPPKLLPIDNFTELAKYRNNWKLEQKRRLDSSGNYEMVMGIITGFDFSLQPDGGYECSIEVKSIGSSVYGLSNVAEAVTEQDKQNEIDIRKKTSKQISEIIDSYISNARDLNRTYGFSSGILEKNKRGIKSKIDSKDSWISFDLFIKLINREKVFQFEDKSEAFKINIENSWISASPNIKSTNGSVLLIPNPFSPAWSVHGDNMDMLSENSLFLSHRESMNSKFTNANKALSKMNQLLRKSKTKNGYTGIIERVDLSSIISFLNVDNNGIPKSFPDREKPYSGHIGNLYISKKMIVESLESTQLTIQGLHDILRKMSFAAANCWEFAIIADPDNKSNVCIIDINFPGFDNENNLINTDSIKTKNEFYTFSSTDSNSILRGLDFSVNLSDEVGTQIMMSQADTNVSRDEDKLFQRTFLSPSGSVTIVDNFSRLNARSEIIHKSIDSGSDDKDEDLKVIQPLNYSDYYPVTVDMGGSTVHIRLVEPNYEIVQAALSQDSDEMNSTRFNGLVQGVTVNLTLTGISGIRFMDVFDISNLPYPYKPNAIFQVTNVKHSWSHNDWITNIEGMIRPSPKMFLN